MKRLLLLLLVIGIGTISDVSRQELLAQENVDTRRMTATITGRIVWDGHDLSHANVSVYRDETLRELYVSGIPKLGDGRFTLRVEPGQYYLVAYVDVDKSGNFDTGDGFGIFGITTWNDEGQKYQIIKIDNRETARDIEIPITARATRINGKFNIVPESEYRPTELQQFQADLRTATSGCRGTVMLAQNDETPKPFASNGRKALILAYTDLSWKYRAGITTVADSGEWELNLLPGKYYLMAIVDNNSTNRLDTGDAFGFYGVENMRKRGEFPEPVLVSPNKFTENIGITITATYQQRQKTKQKNSSILTGNVSLPGDTPARVEVYAEAALVSPIASGETAADGTFHIALPAGEYYVIVNLDADKNGRYSEGDGLGGYGTLDITTTPPAPITLNTGESRNIELLLSARYDADGHLHATPPGIEAHIEQGSITGRITWDGHQLQRGILTLSYTPDFNPPIAMPISVAETGNYHVNVLPGIYYVMAIMDANDDGKTGITDGVGIYGTRYPARGEPTPVSVFAGKTTSHIDIEILASYIDEEGNMAEIEDGGRWEIKRRYGEPEDVFSVTRNGRVNEEWKYWTEGIGFLWKANGAGWEFGGVEEFTPKKNIATDSTDNNSTEASELGSVIATEQKDAASIERLPGFIYFGYDGIIWGMRPDGSSMALGAGHSPTVAKDGTLVYQDTDGNVIIRGPDIPNGGLLLDRQTLANDVAISPDAEYIAYTRPGLENRSRVVMQHISSGSEYVVPSTALKSFTPAWNSDGSMLAYVTAGTIENPDAVASNPAQQRRNIYAFDQVKTSVEPIVVSDADDAQPAWSPVNPNQLAFTRTEGTHQQIWLITYSDAGVPTERQLTQKGGSDPVWIPPEGHWILYENNGQLWKIDTQNPETTEMPLLHNGQAVFGYKPAIVLGNGIQTNTNGRN